MQIPPHLPKGQLLASAATDQTSNNPHHTEYVKPASSKLFANDHAAGRKVVMDLTEPLRPKEIAAFGNLAGYAMPLSFLLLPNGNVLASFQSAAHGDHAGHDVMAMSGTS